MPQYWRRFLPVLRIMDDAGSNPVWGTIYLWRKMKRVIPACSPEHECSDEEISALHHELLAVEADPEVIKYVNPETTVLGAIVEKATAYTGEWYHSSVVIPGSREQTADMAEYNQLCDKLEELGAEHGLFLLFEYSFASEEDLKNFNFETPPIFL
jgi:hypothetical protein